MRIFITGATGFLGSYLVRECMDRGHDVAALLRPNGDPWRIGDIISRLHLISGTLDQPESLRPRLQDFKPQCVFHLAWEGVANVARDNPAQARNIHRTLELAELSAQIGVGCFIGAGSQAEYGPYPHAIVETDATCPTTLYGKAKLAAGDMAAQLLHAHRVRFAWLRVFSTYGPKDAEYWLIPSMIRTLREKRRMSLTACEQLWGFLYAADAAAAFRFVAEDETAAGVYNVGSPDGPSLRDTVTMLRDLVDPTAKLGFGEVPYRADQVMVLRANVDRLLALGWRPQVPLALGLRRTVESYDTLQNA